MGDENTDQAVAEGATTPAPAEPAGSVTSTEPEKPAAPSIGGDPWDFGDEEKPIEAKPSEKTPVEAKKPDDQAKTDETDDEEKAIAEAFDEQEKADKKADDEKAPKTDEDVDKQDPEEMLKSQRNATARSYLQRAERVYAPAKDYKYGNIPVGEFHDRLNDFIGEEKTNEFASFEAHRLVDQNPETAFARIYAIKMLARDPNWQYSPDKVPNLDDIVSGKREEAAPVSKETASGGPPPGELADITKALDSVVDFDWRDAGNDDKFVDEREMKMAQVIRGLEQKAIAEGKVKSELSEKLGNLEKNVEKINENVQTEEQKKVGAKLNDLMVDYRKVIEDKIAPHIRRTTGLEVSKDDTPEIVDFKNRKMALFLGDEYQRSTGSVSRFEAFAYDESSVGAALRTTTENLVQVQLKEAIAATEGKDAEVKKYHDEAKSFLLTFSKLFGEATKEFKKKYVDPDIELLGIRARKVAEPILEASQRKETVSTGSGAPATRAKKREYASADDIWDSMPAEAAEDERSARAA